MKRWRGILLSSPFPSPSLSPSLSLSLSPFPPSFPSLLLLRNLSHQISSISDQNSNDSKQNDEKYLLQKIEEKMGFKNLEDWYNITIKDIKKYGAQYLGRYRNGGLPQTVKSLHPNHNWMFWRFKRPPQKYWNSLRKNPGQQQKLIDWLIPKFGITNPSEWENISLQQLQTVIPSLPNLCIFYKILQTVYSERFVFNNQLLEQEIASHRAFFDNLAVQLDIKQPEQWYKVKKKTIYEKGGEKILQIYNNLLQEALSTVYPEHKWIPFNFETVHRGFWGKKENHRKFFDWLRTQLGFQEWDDWYRLQKRDIYKNGGSKLLNAYYNGSPSQALMVVYVEHNWMPWRFVALPQWFRERLSTDIKEQRRMMDWLGEQLSIKQLNEWYRVSLQQIRKILPFVGFKSSLMLSQLLLSAYPEHEWERSKMSKHFKKKSSQRLVFLALQQLFPEADIYEDYTDEDMMFENGRVMELDIYVPSISLAIEYQGQQHYQNIPSIGEQIRYIDRDQEKRRLCKKLGITLIEVPYWWDRNPNSLAATIHNIRSDLIPIQPSSQPIPTEPNSNSLISLLSSFEKTN